MPPAVGSRSPGVVPTEPSLGQFRRGRKTMRALLVTGFGIVLVPVAYQPGRHLAAAGSASVRIRQVAARRSFTWRTSGGVQASQSDGHECGCPVDLQSLQCGHPGTACLKEEP